MFESSPRMYVMFFKKEMSTRVLGDNQSHADLSNKAQRAFHGNYLYRTLSEGSEF